MLGERRAYPRDDGTPGWEAVEEIVGGLEGGAAVSFSSGMAGIAAIFDVLPTGSVVALSDDCYQGVAGLAATGQSRGRWRVDRIDVADVDLICAAQRKPGATLGVDNTFATPVNQRPLGLGADVSVQSVHDGKLLASLRQSRELTGATPGTLEAFLAVRLERAQSNARMLAERLARHPRVAVTRYSGLAAQPTHEAARRQLKEFGTMISFDVRGDAAAADGVCSGLQLIPHATSLGGGGVHHRTAGQHPRAGAPATDAAATERGDRGSRGSLDGSGPSVAERGVGRIVEVG